MSEAQCFKGMQTNANSPPGVTATARLVVVRLR
jgi:hypothetical protein